MLKLVVDNTKQAKTPVESDDQFWLRVAGLLRETADRLRIKKAVALETENRFREELGLGPRTGKRE